MLGIKEIQEIIPHRHPFLLIDCIEELEPGFYLKNHGAIPAPYLDGLKKDLELRD